MGIISQVGVALVAICWDAVRRAELDLDIQMIPSQELSACQQASR